MVALKAGRTLAWCRATVADRLFLRRPSYSMLSSVKPTLRFELLHRVYYIRVAFVAPVRIGFASSGQLYYTFLRVVDTAT